MLNSKFLLNLFKKKFKFYRNIELYLKPLSKDKQFFKNPKKNFLLTQTYLIKL